MPVACNAAGIPAKPSSQGKKAKKSKKSKNKKLETASSASVSGSSSRRSPVTSSDPVQRLALLQEFDGAFPMTDELAVAVGRSFADLTAHAAAAAAASPGVALVATCFSSAVAIVYLQTVLAGRKDEWELMAAKTLKWLQSKVGSEAADGLIAAAENFVLLSASE
jgi:hypothetical protein